jgi:hypothetical protein
MGFSDEIYQSGKELAMITTEQKLITGFACVCGMLMLVSDLRKYSS